MADPILSNHPDWFKLSAEEQDVVITNHFDATVASNPDFQQMPETQQNLVRLNHRNFLEQTARQSEFNPANVEGARNKRIGARGSAIEQWGSKGIDSHESFALSSQWAGDIVTGNYDDKLSTQLSEYYLKEDNKIVTQEEKILSKDIKQFKEGWAEDPSILSRAGEVWDLALDVATNPGVVMDIGADSMASITSMMMAGWAGAKIGAGFGALIPIPGATAVSAAIGARFGAAGGAGAQASQTKFAEILRRNIEAQGLSLTPTGIDQYLKNNPEAVEEARVTSLKYGAGMGIAEVAFGHVIGKLASMPTKAARKTAVQRMAGAPRAELEAAAAKAKMPVDEFVEGQVVLHTKNELAKQTFKSKLGHKAGAVAAEPISEASTEATALAVAGEDIEGEELLYEALGGIGAGPYGAAVNVGLFGTKVGTDKTKEFAKKIMASTPESRAANQVNKDELKVVKEQRQAPAESKYKQKVADATPESVTDEDIAKNPLKSAEILAKPENHTPDTFERLETVRRKFSEGWMKNMEEWDALNTRKEAGEELTNIEQDRLTALNKITDEQTAIHDKLVKYSVAARDKMMKAAAQEKLEPLKEDASPEEVAGHVLRSLGSMQQSNEELDKLEKDPNTTPEAKELIASMRKDNIARENLEKALNSKSSIAAVAQDIYGGINGSDFKGIDAYQKSISYYLEEGNLTRAQEELDGLKRFAEFHKEKADKFNELYEKALATRDPKTRRTETFTFTHGPPRKDKSNTFFVNGGSAQLVQHVNAEAAALAGNVETATKAFAMQKKTPGIAPTVAKTSATKPATGFKLSQDKIGKDQGKADKANAFIGYGSDQRKSSTGQYADDAKQQGIPVNDDIKPDKNTTAFVSVSREGTYNAQTISQAERILDAGGTVIMDAQGTGRGQSHSSWNKKGEGAVQEALTELYGPPKTTKEGYSIWENVTRQEAQPAETTTEEKPPWKTDEDEASKDNAPPVKISDDDVIFYHKETDSKHMAATRKDGTIYVNIPKAKAYFERKDESQPGQGKALMFQKMGITSAQFRSLFGSFNEFVDFLIGHEASHARNNDSKHYPIDKVTKELLQKDPKAVEIEYRATMDALTKAQKAKLAELVKKSDPARDNTPTEPTPEQDNTPVQEKDSTPENIPDNLADYEDPNYGGLDVEYTEPGGEKVTQPFTEAMNDINEQIREMEAIKRCVTKKR